MWRSDHFWPIRSWCWVCWPMTDRHSEMSEWWWAHKGFMVGSNEVLALETTIKPDKPSINDSKNQVGKNKKHDLGNFKRFWDKNAFTISWLHQGLTRSGIMLRYLIWIWTTKSSGLTILMPNSFPLHNRDCSNIFSLSNWGKSRRTLCTDSYHPPKKLTVYVKIKLK